MIHYGIKISEKVITTDEGTFIERVFRQKVDPAKIQQKKTKLEELKQQCNHDEA